MLPSGVDCHYWGLKPPESNHLRPQTNHNSRNQQTASHFFSSGSAWLWWWEKDDRLKSVISHNPVPTFSLPECLGFGVASCAHRCDRHPWLFGAPYALHYLLAIHTCTNQQVQHVYMCDNTRLIVWFTYPSSALCLCSNLQTIGAVSLLADGNFNLINVCFSIIC